MAKPVAKTQSQTKAIRKRHTNPLDDTNVDARSDDKAKTPQTDKDRKITHG